MTASMFKHGTWGSCLDNTPMPVSGWCAHVPKSGYPAPGKRVYSVLSGVMYHQQLLWMEYDPTPKTPTYEDAYELYPYFTFRGGAHLAPFIERDILMALEREPPTRFEAWPLDVVKQVLKDVATAYNHGNSELKLGPSLEYMASNEPLFPYVRVDEAAVQYRLNHPVYWENTSGEELDV